MIEFVKGNILESKAEALVNTVNTVGVMGKGIALAFKNSFPQVFHEYEKAVNNLEISVGKVQVVKTNMLSPKYVINFPTKKHWRYPSKVQFIEDGLNDLVDKIEKYNIKSIAIPPLGCGNGNLEWTVIKSLLIKTIKNFRKR
ncbi:MAG: macro domain-containing protein [Thiohalospira sp.]